jgi:hypothetical protein
LRDAYLIAKEMPKTQLPEKQIAGLRNPVKMLSVWED